MPLHKAGVRGALASCGAALSALAFACQGLAAPSGADWPVFGHDAGGGQRSPLTGITPANVTGLRQAWSYAWGETGVSELTAVHVNSRLYGCTPMGRAFALDPATGRELWVAEPQAKGADGRAVTDKPARRGSCKAVAYWSAAAPVRGAACQKRIFWGDGNSQLYAADADTGRFCRDFGAAKGHHGFVSNLDFDNYGKGVTSSTSPPVIVGDVVVASQGVNDQIPATSTADGFTRAFDVRTGELKWAFDPVPADKRDVAGAGNVWTIMSADLARGLVFVSTSALSPDFYGGDRTFDAPLANAVVAIHAATGRIAWSRQVIHHDIWDYDLPGHALLVTIRKDGRSQDVAVQQTKMGSLYVYDRATGRPVFPIVERPVPQSTVPGEMTSPTQPIPVLPEPFGRQSFGRDDVFGPTPADRQACLKVYDATDHAGLFTPPGMARPLLIYPSTGGGGNWGGAAYDPTTNLLVVRSTDAAMVVPFGPATDPHEATARIVNLHGGYPFWTSPSGLPCSPPPWVTLTAVDMNTGRIAWRIPYGKTVWPDGKPHETPAGWGGTNVFGGPMITASGLIFMGGVDDDEFRALDLKTGKVLWSDHLDLPAQAVPMTYRTGGKQFVVVAVAGRGKGGRPRLVAYALNGA